MDYYILSNGQKIPVMGFGTYDPDGTDTEGMVKNAIGAGMRYFDTASLYGTERALGRAIKGSGIKREEFFIATKVWIDELGYENTKQALKRSLERLDMDYVDLYLIHWPRRREGDEDWKEVDRETWKAMEELCDAGFIKGLGLSNFLPHHIDNILENCRIKPVVDQLEIHPGYSQEAAVAYCFSHGIRPEAWSPLGRGTDSVLNNDVLFGMAEKYGKSIAQIALRFEIQKGIIPLPKAASTEHIRANMEALEFTLSKEDLSMLSCMPQTTWLGEHPDYKIPTKKSDPNQ